MYTFNIITVATEVVDITIYVNPFVTLVSVRIKASIL